LVGAWYGQATEAAGVYLLDLVFHLLWINRLSINQVEMICTFYSINIERARKEIDGKKEHNCASFS